MFITLALPSLKSDKMRKLLLILCVLVSISGFSQYNIDRILFDVDGKNDTVFLKAGTDSLFRHNTSGQYAFASKVKNKRFINVTDVTGAQSTLVSGTTIKTVNNTSLLGSGDIPITKSSVGLGNADNTSDVNKPISSAEQTALNLKADLSSPALSGTPTAPTASAGTNNTQLATTAYVVGVSTYGKYRTVLEASGSHIAAKVAGTYGIGHGDPLAVSGTGTLYPLQIIYIAAADYPSINGLAPKLRIRAQLFTNDVAPTGNFTVGLYPVTRPATSGGAGLNIYTLGTVVSGSNGATFTTPAADGQFNAASSDFALPADGFYVIGVVTTATVATSSLVHITVQLQIHNN
jgi:hypothetical protein